MRYKLYITLAIILLCNPVIAHAEEKYICVCENSVGFKYNASSRTWENVRFQADNKYIISKSNEKDCAFKVTGFDQYTEFTCKGGVDDSGFLYCEAIKEGEFRFNKKNGRFLRTHLLGYIEVTPESCLTDEKTLTPFIEIGVCSPF
ncbi:MAG TPA: hypothetical protein VMW89_15145 [Desulfatiglandales bacterium]|nr:hypothetical protein [Desulfatiglandales bacterium]